LHSHAAAVAATRLQVLALAAVRATPVLTQRCRDIISTNLAIADGFFARWREVFDWQSPQASNAVDPWLNSQGAAG
jgi:hypothetical protein